MGGKCGCLCLMTALVLLLGGSCKPKSDKAQPSAPAPSAAEIVTLRDSMTRGMEPIAFASLAAAHVGRQCVVTTRAMEQGAGGDAAPPPLGMVHRLGLTTLYKGEIQDVSADRLKIRAPYPTSGQYKTIEISRTEIQSLHVAQSPSK